MSNIESKIREMAKLSILSNRINEVQEKNLKMWPLVFFNGVESFRLEYDFDARPTAGDDKSPQGSSVSYFLETDGDKPAFELQNNRLDVRLSTLTTSVRNLFWKNTRVSVYLNDELIYESENG